MDIRIVKTKKRISDAFLKLREKKSVEKISVTELCSPAGINKFIIY